MNKRYFIRVFRQAAIAWNNNNAPSCGAAIAYYTVFSLAPLLLIAVNVASLVIGTDAARKGLASQLEPTLGSPTADALLTLLDNSYKSGGNAGFTVLGLCVFLLGASGVFAQIQDCLNVIWKTAAPVRVDNVVVHFLKHRLLSFMAVVLVGFLLLAFLIMSSVLTALTHWTTVIPGSALMWHGASMLVSVSFITLLFALIFKLLPDVAIAWKHVWVGAMLTAMLFTLGQQLIGLYLGQVGPASAFGAAGSVVVLLVWVYYSAQILLFGAEFTHAMVQDKLKLTPEQLQTIRELSNKQNQTLADIQRHSTADPAAAAQEFQDFRKQHDELLNSILTPRQRQTWIQMTGQAYDFTPEALRMPKK